VVRRYVQGGKTDFSTVNWAPNMLEGGSQSLGSSIYSSYIIWAEQFHFMDPRTCSETFPVLGAVFCIIPEPQGMEFIVSWYIFTLV
jgi:hypothetical protein